MAKSVRLRGVTYPGINKIDVPLAYADGNATFYDITGIDNDPSVVLEGNSVITGDGVVQGTMPNNGDLTSQISVKDAVVNVLQGYTSGGSVTIAASERNKIIPSNIKAGITILGVEGSNNVIDTATTDGAISGDIAQGKVAFVNGQRIVGTGTFFDISETTATPEDVAEGKIFFTADGRRAVGTASVNAATLYYHNWDGSIILATQNFIITGEEAIVGTATVGAFKVTESHDGTYTGTPSRPSDEEYRYTFIGWSLYPDSYVNDPNCTKNVLSNRHVYAAYSREQRGGHVT